MKKDMLKDRLEIKKMHISEKIVEDFETIIKKISPFIKPALQNDPSLSEQWEGQEHNRSAVLNVE